MKNTNFERHFQEQLAKRTLTPSNSAWERLSDRLDAEEQKSSTKRLLYIAYAAAAAVLIFWLLSGPSQETIETPIQPNQDLVTIPIDTTTIQKNLQQLLPSQTSPVEIVTVDTPKKEELRKSIPTTKNKETLAKKISKEVLKPKKVPVVKPLQHKENRNIVVADLEPKKIVEAPISTSTIRVNSDALLYSVTHSPEEIKKYYAVYQIDRNKVLEQIQQQLKESKLRVNASAILAEVELELDENTFKNNFMQSIKKRVSDIATAIASRND